jgi:hypothetical protein
MSRCRVRAALAEKYFSTIGDDGAHPSYVLLVGDAAHVHSGRHVVRLTKGMTLALTSGVGWRRVVRNLLMRILGGVSWLNAV